MTIKENKFTNFCYGGPGALTIFSGVEMYLIIIWQTMETAFEYLYKRGGI